MVASGWTLLLAGVWPCDGAQPSPPLRAGVHTFAWHPGLPTLRPASADHKTLAAVCWRPREYPRPSRDSLSDARGVERCARPGPSSQPLRAVRLSNFFALDAARGLGGTWEALVVASKPTQTVSSEARRSSSPSIRLQLRAVCFAAPTANSPAVGSARRETRQTRQR